MVSRLSKHLRHRSERFRALPIIAVTAKARRKTIARSACGPVLPNTFAKPLDPELLLFAIEQIAPANNPDSSTNSVSGRHSVQVVFRWLNLLENAGTRSRKRAPVKRALRILLKQDFALIPCSTSRCPAWTVSKPQN